MEVHPCRKRNRLNGYDYSQDGRYFVTICIKDRMRMFGDVRDDIMILNKYGEIVKKQWLWLAQQYDYIDLDEFIIMPNHVHGILIINNGGNDTRKIKSLSELMGAFKTTSSKIIHLDGLEYFAWQRSFYDHIIRNENVLSRIREYIVNNPIKWAMEKDRNHVDYVQHFDNK